MIDCVVSETLFWNKTANIHQWKILELNLGPIWEPWQKSSHTWAILSISWSLRHWTLLVRLLSLLLPKTINTYLYTFKPQNKISFWNGVESDSLRRSQKFARSQIWFFFRFMNIATIFCWDSWYSAAAPVSHLYVNGVCLYLYCRLHYRPVRAWEQVLRYSWWVFC